MLNPPFFLLNDKERIRLKGERFVKLSSEGRFWNTNDRMEPWGHREGVSPDWGFLMFFPVLRLPDSPSMEWYLMAAELIVVLNDQVDFRGSFSQNVTKTSSSLSIWRIESGCICVFPKRNWKLTASAWLKSKDTGGLLCPFLSFLNKQP